MNLWKWWHQEKLIFRENITGSELTKNTAMFFFIILAALIARTSYIAAAVFAAIAFIFAEFRHDCCFNEDGYLGRIEKGYETEADYLSAKADYKKDLKKLTQKHIKDVIKFLIPVAAVLAVALIICNFLDGRNFEQYSFFATAVVAVVLVVPVFLERTFTDRNERYGGCYSANRIISEHKTSQAQKLKLKLLMYSSCVLVAAGLALSFCIDIFYAAFTIAGCIVYLILKLTERKYFMACPLKEECGGASQPSPAVQDGDNGKGKMLYDSEVLRLVQKIADRWSYKSDSVLYSYEGGGSVKYSVSVEIVGGNFINYTINGRLSGVRDDKLDSALSGAKSKMNKAAYEIKQETQRELSKHTLPYDSYEINVYQGYVQ